MKEETGLFYLERFLSGNIKEKLRRDWEVKKWESGVGVIERRKKAWKGEHFFSLKSKSTLQSFIQFNR